MIWFQCYLPDSSTTNRHNWLIAPNRFTKHHNHRLTTRFHTWAIPRSGLSEAQFLLRRTRLLPQRLSNIKIPRTRKVCSSPCLLNPCGIFPNNRFQSMARFWRMTKRWNIVISLVRDDNAAPRFGFLHFRNRNLKERTFSRLRNGPQENDLKVPSWWRIRRNFAVGKPSCRLSPRTRDDPAVAGEGRRKAEVSETENGVLVSLEDRNRRTMAVDVNDKCTGNMSECVIYARCWITRVIVKSFERYLLAAVKRALFKN